MLNLKAGQFVRFRYQHPPGSADDATGDPHKEVFVLNPSWLGEMHGIDLKRLTPAEREVLVAIFNPATRPARKGQPIQLRDAVPPGLVPLVTDIMNRMNPREEITNPLAFYHKFVRPFLRDKDAYRRYKPTRMQNVTVTRRSTVLGNVQNPKPLFHKVETKPQSATQPGQQPGKGSEHGQVRKMTPDQIAAMAKQMGVKVSAGKKPAVPLTPAQRIAAMKAAQKKRGKT